MPLSDLARWHQPCYLQQRSSPRPQPMRRAARGITTAPFCNADLGEGGLLEGQEARTRRHERPVEGRVAVHVRWRVLEEALTLVLVGGRVKGQRLEAAPPHREDQWIAVLQDALVPAVLLEARLRGKGQRTAEREGGGGGETPGKGIRDRTPG